MRTSHNTANVVCTFIMATGHVDEDTLLGTDDDVLDSSNSKQIMSALSSLQKTMDCVATGITNMGAAFTTLAAAAPAAKVTDQPSSSGKRKIAETGEGGSDDDDTDDDDNDDMDDDGEIESLLSSAGATKCKSKSSEDSVSSKSDSLFHEMESLLEDDDDVGPDVSEKLANITNKAFSKQLPIDIVKRKKETHKRPRNCDIDDTYLQGDTIEACNQNVIATANILREYGFVINPEKSVFGATQKLEFLGFILNSVEMTVSITENKSEKIVSICRNYLSSKKSTIRELCTVIGNLVASFPAVTHGKLFYRQLENEKIAALKEAKGQFDAAVSLSKQATEDLQWWLSNIPGSKAPITRGQPDLVIETDASTLGWGCNCQSLNLSAGGPWKHTEADHHINVLELQAVYFALQSLFNDKHDIHIHVLVDNTTAVAYIREQGGSRSLECNAMVRQIWMWAYKRNIWLSVSHIPGISNQKADFESRHFRQENEWMLDQKVFQAAISKLQFLPEIDLFATRNNCQLSKYVSWRPEPESHAVDAFSISWAGMKLYCFPPFSVIPAVLQKMVMDKSVGILVMPNWPTQPYYATAMKMLLACPLFIPKRKTLLQLPAKTDVHKIWDKLDLLICLLSGDQLQTEAFRKTLPTFCSHHGDQKHPNNTNATYASGKSSVVEGKLIPFGLL